MGNLKAGTEGEWKEEEDDSEGEGGEDEAKDSVAFIVLHLLFIVGILLDRGWILTGKESIGMLNKQYTSARSRGSNENFIK